MSKTERKQARKRWPLEKLAQLWRLVLESHEHPLTGTPRKPVVVAPNQTGITFIGHSSFLLQIGGKNVLIDPVFSKRLVLLRRQRRAGVTVAGLPAIDLVLITHAHMDHLDLPSLRGVVRNARKQRVPAPVIVVPTGVDDLVRRLGFFRVETMSPWNERRIAGLDVTMTPCRHWGARMFKDTHRRFGGYTLTPQSGGLTVYHSGDTAYFNGFREIGSRLHPDIALLPIGAYFPDSYRSVHTNPEEAVLAFLDVGARWMVPMHYGTFRLGREPMHEPLERLAAEAARLGLDRNHRVQIMAEGETLPFAANGCVVRPPGLAITFERGTEMCVGDNKIFATPPLAGDCHLPRD